MLRTLFDSPKQFVPAEVELYGKSQKARLCERVLYWQGLLLKFVLSINEQGHRAIFVSTHLELSAATIVNTYSLRFKIEAGFRSLAQVLLGFCQAHHLKPQTPWRALPEVTAALDGQGQLPAELQTDVSPISPVWAAQVVSRMGAAPQARPGAGP